MSFRIWSGMGTAVILLSGSRDDPGLGRRFTIHGKCFIGERYLVEIGCEKRQIGFKPLFKH